MSLFSGAGGLDHGFKSAGFKIGAAFDLSPAAIETHKRNFPGSQSLADDLSTLGPRGVADAVKRCLKEGSRIGIIGGPPCQGFSRANTTATAADPRNKLPRLYINIVRELQKHFEVDFAVFENVLGMRDKKHATAYSKVLRGLKALGFEITEKELCALDFGVPQTRRRIVLSALRPGKKKEAPTHGMVEDPSKLAKPKPTAVDECDLATKALTKVSKLFDVDDYLSSEPPVMDEMLEATCKLLEAARYDPAEYRLWAKLDFLAVDCGLRLVIDETTFEFDLLDGRTAKRVQGPFKLLTDVEKKLDALHAAKHKSK